MLTVSRSASLESIQKSIYTDLYPEREKSWEYVPKTLIFAKNDNHATEIVEAVKDVFKVRILKTGSP